MRYAREVGVKKPWGATERSGAKPPILGSKNDQKKTPKRGYLLPLGGESAFYLGWERV